MTLVLACGNTVYTAVVADRRLTRNGRVIDDESGKVMLVNMPTARLGLAYCGLARARGSFRTNFDLPSLLRDAFKESSDLDELVTGFAARLDEAFAALPPRVAMDDRELAVVLAGYGYDGHGRAHRFARAVGNRSSATEAVHGFGVEDVFAGKPTNYICELGVHEAVARDGIDALGELVKANKPPRAVVGKAVDIIRQAADTPRAAGVIGRQLTSLIIPADPSRPSLGDYHTEHPSDRLYCPDVLSLDASGNGNVLVSMNLTTALLTDAEAQVRDMRARLGASQDARQRFPPIVYPSARRNDPCPCGSGLKFKRCHGE